MSCDFPENPCRLKRLDPAAYPIVQLDGPAIGRKAACRPSTGEIWIDSAFLDSDKMKDPATGKQDPIKVLAILLHEVAHAEGARCEPCADRRAGQLFRELGIGASKAAASMFVHTLQNRSGKQAARNFTQGYRGQSDVKPGQVACSGDLDAAGLCKVKAASPAVHGADALTCGCLRDHGPAAALQAADASTTAAQIVVADPRSAPYAGMVTDQAAKTWPQAPELFAWILSSLIAGESQWKPLITAPNKDVAGNVLSTDLGLCQINDKAHPDLAARKLPDGSPAWKDPAANIAMGAQVLADCLRAFPTYLWAAISAYNGGANAVRAKVAAGGSPDEATTGGNYGYQVLTRIHDWTGRDALDPAQWDQGTAPASGWGASLGLSIPTTIEGTEASSTFLLVLAIVLFVLFARHLKES